MTRVLITGANGFVGRWCVPCLVDRFEEVHAAVFGEVDPPLVGVTQHTIDMLNDDAADLIREIQPTHLLHLAWIATPGVYWQSPLNAQWVEASASLTEAFIANGGRRLVGVGSCAEYDWSGGRCIEDDTLLSDATPYAREKNRCRRELQGLCENAGIAFAWARLFFVWGPGEPPGKLIPSVINGLLRGERVSCSAGDHRRDFVYIRNAAAALAALVASDMTGPVNIGSGKARTIREIVEPIGRMLQRDDLLAFDRPTPDESPRVEACVKRLSDELGFTPLIDHATALTETIDYWRAEIVVD